MPPGRVILCLALLCHGVMTMPAGAGLLHAQEAVSQTPAPLATTVAAAATTAVTPRRLHGRFLHITDFHPDAFYKVHTSTDSSSACHRGTGPAGTYGAETSDCDSPLSLADATFDWIAANIKDDIDFVVWTGDSARHDSDEEIPRTQDQILQTNRLLAAKFAAMFANPTGRGLSIPVIPTLGNNDILPHNILYPGPNKWLSHYSELWRPFVPEEQRHGFEFGGWYYVEVVPNRLAVFSLNTLYFFDHNAAVDDCIGPTAPGFKQFEWLRVQLGFMRRRGLKAILIGHVPPARTPSKQLWEESCWQKYTLWLHQYRDVVVASLYGHMNIDHFMLQDTKDVSLGLLGNASTRKPMKDELSAESAVDYLQELRDGWSKIPAPPAKRAAAAGTEGGEVDGRGRKHKEPKSPHDPLAERYHLSLVSPSIIPNYFPTLRVMEYNTSGFEDTPVWVDNNSRGLVHPPSMPPEHDQQRLDLRGPADGEFDSSKSTSGKKGKKGKKQRPKKDPNLVIPDPPADSSLPGPAHSPQPFSLTGYTQYFANLTHINNDMTARGVDGGRDGGDKEPVSSGGYGGGFPIWSWAGEVLRWRRGKNVSRQPKLDTPKPRNFTFEVEYSTFDDDIYNLGDLTVRSYLELAYQMGQTAKGGTRMMLAGGEGGLGDDSQEALAPGEDEEDDDASDRNGDDNSEEEGGEEEEEEEMVVGGKKGDKKKKKTPKKKPNKIWMHFLKHAFVGTMDKKDRKKIA